DFHGYSTYLGTTYNAYLILDEKITLIDTAKSTFGDELVSGIAKIVDPKKIDYVVSNHTEMDHSGSLARVMHKIGEDKPVFCSQMGQKNLKKHFYTKLNFQAVSNGQDLRIGKRTLRFLETRMLHWPDSMFSYLVEEEILFSSDAFGQHYASMERFDDEVKEDIMPHAKKYFANILLPYAPLILKLVNTVKEMKLNFKMLCPDHGIIWRNDPLKIINAYVEWAQQRPKRKALVIYDTMWNSTKKMAEEIASGIYGEGVEAKVMHLRDWHRSDIITDVLDAAAIVVGSPTLNNGLFPTVADFLTYMKGLRPQNKIGGAFGSYGWSGEAANIIQKELEAMKFKMVLEPLRIQYVPDEEALSSCKAFGNSIAQEVKKVTN
ncbi:MAG: FprA family A-type flavoprotein, partial [Desulfatiglandales bacterium]